MALRLRVVVGRTVFNCQLPPFIASAIAVDSGLPHVEQLLCAVCSSRQGWRLLIPTDLLFLTSLLARLHTCQRLAIWVPISYILAALHTWPLFLAAQLQTDAFPRLVSQYQRPFRSLSARSDTHPRFHNLCLHFLHQSTALNLPSTSLVALFQIHSLGSHIKTTRQLAGSVFAPIVEISFIKGRVPIVTRRVWSSFLGPLSLHYHRSISFRLLSVSAYFPCYFLATVRFTFVRLIRYTIHCPVSPPDVLFERWKANAPRTDTFVLIARVRFDTPWSCLPVFYIPSFRHS
ncbi:hypothetical protein BJ170DRAFT_400781 [Xylariales sp. AK1849]|nr:hypothetical protein BJ170DRAFT_400781 [Xylariales sp. AK1849]